MLLSFTHWIFSKWISWLSPFQTTIFSHLFFLFVHWKNSQNTAFNCPGCTSSCNLLFVIFLPTNFLKVQVLRDQFSKDPLINKFNGLFWVLLQRVLCMAIKITVHLFLLEKLLELEEENECLFPTERFGRRMALG